MSIIGYARVSTDDQNLDLQRDALNAVGCDTIFEDDGVSAIAQSRPGFEKALIALKPGSKFVVWKMDRAFRSLRHALDTLEEFQNIGVELVCLSEPIDTSTPLGKAMYQMRNVFSELERGFISERTKEGMAAAKSRGKHVGRPAKVSPGQLKAAHRDLEAGCAMEIVASRLRMSPKILERRLRSYRDTMASDRSFEAPSEPRMVGVSDA